MELIKVNADDTKERIPNTTFEIRRMDDEMCIRDRGDTITWTTKLGARTYEVTSVQKVKETDTSGTVPSTENMLTLYTLSLIHI